MLSRTKPVPPGAERMRPLERARPAYMEFRDMAGARVIECPDIPGSLVLQEYLQDQQRRKRKAEAMAS